jgi:Rhodopirellula transposase DDE domain
MADVGGLAHKFDVLAGVLDERTRRLVAAAEAEALGFGGVSAVARASGLSRGTVIRGMAELKTAPEATRGQRIRQKGAGRKRTVDQDATLERDLESLVEPVTRGDPESPLRWTCKSVRQLAAQLDRLGHKTSHRMVAEILHGMDYSLQANRKTLEGASHPDRDAQFQHISHKIREFQADRQPVISVDTKKKELVGDFKNNGRELRPKGEPEKVRVHDFVIPKLGRAAPYGVYDVTQNAGWVSVGVDHDTAAFAAQSIRRWWESMGQEAYPQATRLLITADSGGSNGARVRLWKLELQRLADETGMEISICHLPPGTSKWNKIEHRLFSFISQNWRGKPLVSHQVIVNLIAATTTKAGLRVRAEVDPGQYPKGVKVSDKDLASIRIERDKFHGDWNYTILPHSV